MFNLARKTSYVGWNDYRSMLDELDDYLFRQETRRQSLQNLNNN